MTKTWTTYQEYWTIHFTYFDYWVSKKPYRLITVKHLIFAWPYFREAITHDLFTRLYIRDLPYLLLLSLHKELLARTLFSCLYDLTNLRENKVLVNKKSLTVPLIV